MWGAKKGMWGAKKALWGTKKALGCQKGIWGTQNSKSGAEDLVSLAWDERKACTDDLLSLTGVQSKTGSDGASKRGR
jgi:hypothetical protein